MEKGESVRYTIHWMIHFDSSLREYQCPNDFPFSSFHSPPTIPISSFSVVALFPSSLSHSPTFVVLLHTPFVPLLLPQFLVISHNQKVNKMRGSGLAFIWLRKAQFCGPKEWNNGLDFMEGIGWTLWIVWIDFWIHPSAEMKMGLANFGLAFGR